jgi:hypothetical protein
VARRNLAHIKREATEMKWQIKHIFNYPREKRWGGGCAHFGFHDSEGQQYLLEWDDHWLGKLMPDDRFEWTAGAVNKGLSQTHIEMDVNHPHHISQSPDGSLTLSSNGNNKVFKILPEKKSAHLFIDTGKLGFVDVGNCVYDLGGNLWLHEIRGCKVWRFNKEGEPLEVLGNGSPGFQSEPAPFEQVRFNWIYDMRLGPDGNIYVLDSKNFAVRRIDIAARTVTTVVGTGFPGDSGDGEEGSVTFGSKTGEYFDGPLAMALDEEGNIYVGDTFNHVLRKVDHSTKVVTTIAGKRNPDLDTRNDPKEADPAKLNLPMICSLDYFCGCLYVPDMNDDLIVLEKT